MPNYELEQLVKSLQLKVKELETRIIVLEYKGRANTTTYGIPIDYGGTTLPLTEITTEDTKHEKESGVVSA